MCHLGAGSEAGSETCYVKFALVRPGPRAEAAFDRLLSLCEALAASCGMSRLVAGVSMERHRAYRWMLAQGFRSEIQGVAMHRPNNPGYNHPDAFILDDWR